MGLRARLIAMVVGVMLAAFVFLLVGVSFGLRHDVRGLAAASADSGSLALGDAFDARQDAVRSIVLQRSGASELANAIRSNDRNALQAQAADIAESGNLSFVIITDAHGRPLAASRAATRDVAKNPVIAAAALGTVVGGYQVLDLAAIHALGLTRTERTIAIGIASPINVAGQTLGVLYAGSTVDATTKTLSDVSHLSGAQTGIVLDGSLVATSLTAGDGNERVGVAIPDSASVLAARQPFLGEQKILGVDYFVKMTPLTTFDGQAVAAYWVGVPFEQFNAIVDNTLWQIALWGILGVVLASIAGAFFATRIGRAISRRSDEVNDSARALRVLVVGGEVSGDHVERTRATLETIQSIVERDAPSVDDADLRALAGQAVDDVVVIDTLTNELSSRMRDAAARVERLSAVAEELDELVAGARPSRN